MVPNIFITNQVLFWNKSKIGYMHVNMNVIAKATVSSTQMAIKYDDDDHD